MAEKKPLCNYDGVLKELQSGDSLPSSGGTPPIIKGKTASEVVSNSTTYQDDNHIADIQLEANAVYAFRLIHFPYSSNAPVKSQLVFSQTVAQVMGTTWGSDAVAGNPMYRLTQFFINNNTTVVIVNGVTVNNYSWLTEGHIKTSTNAPTVKLQWAQSNANAASSIYYEGSHIILWKIT